MRFIGITGGVGAGKTAILSYLAEKPNTRVMLADEIAHDLMEPGTDCYKAIVEQFAGLDIFQDIHEDIANVCENEVCSERKTDKLEQSKGKQLESDSTDRLYVKYMPFDRGKLACVIFSDDHRREQMNAIVHPAVKDYVCRQYVLEKEKGELELLVLEAALLIEESYDEICDELWYIYTSEENRRKRLKINRGYSDEKIDSIFKSQLSEEEFRDSTQVTIDNNGDLVETMKQIEKALRRKADE